MSTRTEQQCDPWRPDLRARLVKRPGATPAELGISISGDSCPDVIEMDTGDLLIIGVDATHEFRDKLIDGARCGEDECIVIIPRATMLSAAHAYRNSQPADD